MTTLSLYRAFIKIKIKAMVEYRGAFFWGGIAQASSYTAEFILIWIMIQKFQTIGGWGPYEVMFLYALNLLSYAVAGSFLYSPATGLPAMIQSGSLDEVLTKPMNPLLYLICNKFLYQYASHALLSIVIIAVCFYHLQIQITMLTVLMLFVTVISGALIQGSAFLYTSVPAFWIVQSQAIGNFMGDLRGFIRYPLSIYHKGIQIVLTLIIPYGFINFYPAQYFLGKHDFMLFHPVFQFLSPLVGLLLFYGAYQFWKLGIRHYKSTGS